MSKRRPPIAGADLPNGAPPSQYAGFALLPLRAFLGVTFCFAGLQKLANPDFFRVGNPASIQAQLAAAARRSPIHGLLGPLSHHAVAIGVLIALGELAVGIGTLAGLFTRIAATGGLLISFGLFLSVSFHTNPYYTGSDIVFVFAWMPMLIAGGGAWSVDAWAATTIARRRRATQRFGTAPLDVERRRLLGTLALGLGTVAVLGAGAVAGLGRLFHGGSTAVAGTRVMGASSSAPSSAAPSSAAASPERATSAPTSPTPPTTTPKSTAPGTPANHPPGTRLGPASAVPVNGAASFVDPGSGDPALVIQPSAGKFLAFDAVCPHAGCTVQYGGGAFFCPCHGSQFNGTTGAVEVGPARTGLAKIHIAEGPDGQLYAK